MEDIINIHLWILGNGLMSKKTENLKICRNVTEKDGGTDLEILIQ